jgi:DNA mismatch endonuclease (patch repair protein)
MAIRRALHAAGWRYRVDVAPVQDLRRRADIVFRRVRVAVQVDGCFWHGCPEHGNKPKANATWWQTKLADVRARDADTDRRWAEAGWTVVRVWEHESVEGAVARISAVLSDTASLDG